MDLQAKNYVLGSCKLWLYAISEFALCRVVKNRMT